MKYVYMQQPYPSNVTGVPISVYVMDVNNNYRQIGSTTSDEAGTFRLTWTPDIPGDYKVVALFQGSESYYPVSANDGFTVLPAPEATATPTAPPANAADLYLLPGIGVIVAAIAIVGVVLAILMRRR
jgi:hypothetical protein